MVIAAAASLALVACQGPANTGGTDGENDITLRAVTAWDSNNEAHYAPFQRFIDALEEQGDTGITIQVLGGPDTMPPTELAENLSNGTTDIALNTASYYSNTLPESLVLSLTNLSPEEWRERGLYDRVNEWHVDQLNQRVLGRLGWGQKYAMYTADPITKLSDFDGMRIRGVAVYLGILGQLGAEMVDMPAADIYTAIEKGTVSGTAWPEPGSTDLSLQDVINYVIHPPFYTNGLSLYINEDSWQKLSAKQKEAVEKAAVAAEAYGPELADELRERERAVLEAAGVEVTELSDADAEEYLNKAREGAIDVLVTMGIDKEVATSLINEFND